MADDKVSVIEGEVIQQGATSRPIDMESLMAMAVTKGGIEVLERLMVIRREMKEEYAKEQFFIALSKFQSEIKTIQKTKPVNNYDGTLRYMYAPIESIIEQVKDALHTNGFSYTITPEQPEGKVITICEAHHISGYTKTTRCEVPVSSEKGMNAIQHVGEAKSYSKRYAFCDAFGIVTGDGDTDAANVPETKTEAKKEQPKTEQPKTTEEIPTTITVKVTGIKDNAWLKTKDDNGKEVLSHNQIAVEKNSYGIEEIGVPKARTDKACLAGSICKFENITSKVSAKNGKTYYNATEVNTIL
jgi:hypothetical protein